MTHKVTLGLDCAVFMFYVCICLQVFVVCFVGGQIRPHFAQIMQKRALFWNACKEHIHKRQTISQTHFVTFVFARLYGFCFHVGRKINIMLGKKALFYLLRKRNVNRNRSKPQFLDMSRVYVLVAYWRRSCVCMRRPVQDGVYSENLWNPAKFYACICVYMHTMFVSVFAWIFACALYGAMAQVQKHVPAATPVWVRAGRIWWDALDMAAFGFPALTWKEHLAVMPWKYH